VSLFNLVCQCSMSFHVESIIIIMITVNQYVNYLQTFVNYCNHSCVHDPVKHLLLFLTNRKQLSMPSRYNRLLTQNHKLQEKLATVYTSSDRSESTNLDMFMDRLQHLASFVYTICQILDFIYQSTDSRTDSLTQFII